MEGRRRGGGVGFERTGRGEGGRHLHRLEYSWKNPLKERAGNKLLAGPIDGVGCGEVKRVLSSCCCTVTALLCRRENEGLGGGRMKGRGGESGEESVLFCIGACRSLPL